MLQVVWRKDCEREERECQNLIFDEEANVDFQKT